MATEVSKRGAHTRGNNGGHKMPSMAQATVRPHEVQQAGQLVARPIGLDDETRAECCTMLNQALADTIVLRDLYKKHHWQLMGPTFYQLHKLFDKHYAKQVALVDDIAERVQMLGGVAIGMPFDVAEETRIPRPPQGAEDVPTQLQRLLEAHRLVLEQARGAARRASELGDEGTNDLFVSQIIRENEMQVWFLSQHLVDAPLVRSR